MATTVSTICSIDYSFVVYWLASRPRASCRPAGRGDTEVRVSWKSGGRGVGWVTVRWDSFMWRAGGVARSASARPRWKAGFQTSLAVNDDDTRTHKLYRLSVSVSHRLLWVQRPRSVTKKGRSLWGLYRNIVV